MIDGWKEGEQGCHGQGKSQGKKYFFKVREKSGNFVKSQGKLATLKKSGKISFGQGILKILQILQNCKVWFCYPWPSIDFLVLTTKDI